MIVNGLYLWAFHNMKCYCCSGRKHKKYHLKEDGGSPPEDWHRQYDKAYGEAPAGK